MQNHEQRFAESGNNIRDYLNRKRKVDEDIVKSVEEELFKDILANKEELAIEVNEQLGRDDITAGNIDVALEQISANQIRKIVKKEMSSGNLQYKEEYLLEEVLSALQSEDKELQEKGLKLLQRSGIKEEAEEKDDNWEPDKEVIKTLLTPNVALSKIPLRVQLVVFSLCLYGYGIPLSVLGKWLGVHKTTVLRCILGLSKGLWEIISQWIIKELKGTLVYIDEKWLKIKGVWHYWFVVLDGETQIPIFHYLAVKRTKWNCTYVLIRLKNLGFKVKTIVTDGLESYFFAISYVFKNAIHQVCIFHHQQNVTQYIKKYFTDKETIQSLKKKMKKVFQTKDKRTVKNRLKHLEENAQKLGIVEWVESVLAKLPHLLPAIGSCIIPRTNNAIERFFRDFNRFYKVRKGFHSKKSANNQLILFMVFYMFTKKENGIAPIEKILPEANQMPLYKLMNDPFNSLGLAMNSEKNVKQLEKSSNSCDIADNTVKEAD